MELSYAAGLIDGEGYVGIVEAGGSMQVRLKVAMTDKGLPSLRAMRRTFGGRLAQDRPNGERTRASHVWRLNGGQAAELLERLLPLLLTKAEPARIAVEFQRMIDAAPRRTNRQAVWSDDMHRRARIFRARIQDANRTGPDPSPPVLPNVRPLAVRRFGEWWEPDETLFGPVEFEGRLPLSGRMIAGHVYPLPTPAPPTGGPASSSPPGLLPTPSVADSTGGHMTRSGDRSGELLLPGVARQLAGEQLLPTPTASPYGSNQSPSPGAAVRPSLDTLAAQLALHLSE